MSNRYKIVFFGTPEFAVPALGSLLDNSVFDVVAVITQPDKPVGKKQVVTPSPIKLLAQEKGIAILQPAKIKNNQELVDKLRSLAADINVVVAYGKILPREVLDSAKFGSVNVHGSRLPKYRGASPITQAIIDGEKTICVTVQKMVLEMDAGPIIAYGPGIEISDTDTTSTLSGRLALTVPDVLPGALYSITDGSVLAPQDESQASYVKLIRKEDALIDWSQDEELIERKIRAYLPWPVAHTTLGGMAVKIFFATVENIENEKGRVLMRDGELFIGKLKIKELQIAGKNKISGKDFCLGYTKFDGTSVL